MKERTKIMRDASSLPPCTCRPGFVCQTCIISFPRMYTAAGTPERAEALRLHETLPRLIKT